MNRPDRIAGPREDGPRGLDLELDLLVDGELGDAERRDLLARLDATPDGWRRCAVAFLEAQAWRDSLGELARSAAPAPAPVAAIRPRSAWPSRLLAAAMVIAAFGLGVASGRSGRAPAGPGPEVVATNPTVSQPPTPVPIAPEATEAEAGVRTVGLLAIGDPGGDGDPVVNVPILAGPGLDERWLDGQAPAISDDDRRRWRRLGFDVEERREVVSMDLRDGRRVSVPVDRVRLRQIERPPL